MGKAEHERQIPDKTKGRMEHWWVQVVYSGPLDQAAPYFKEVGFVPDELRSNIADYMLDLVIRASDTDVAGMVHRFAGYVALLFCVSSSSPCSFLFHA